MEMRQLRYFVGVARELNFTRAAVKMRVAQPALSRQIRLLEAELGLSLLDRGSRGTRLTPAGEVFLSQASALLEQSERAVQVTRMKGLQQRAQLNIGYVWGLFHTLVPGLIAEFRRRIPEVAVNLFDLTATEQAEALKSGRIDVGFIGFALDAEAAGLEKREVGSSTFMAVLPAGHAAARRRKLSLADLADDFFIVISEETYPGAARALKQACGAAGFRPKILQTAERGYTILGLVAGNCGVTLLPASLQALPHRGVTFRQLVDAPENELYVAWNGASETGIVSGFLDFIPRWD